MRLGYLASQRGHGPDAVALAVKDAMAGKRVTLIVADVPTPQLGRPPRAYRVERMAMGTNPFEANRPCLVWLAQGSEDVQDPRRQTILFSHREQDPALAAARAMHHLMRYAIKAREECDVRMPEVYRPLDELELDPVDPVHLAFTLEDELTEAQPPAQPETPPC